MNPHSPDNHSPDNRRPLVLVKYLRMQEGYAALPPFALYNVVAGPLEILHGTFTLQTLAEQGYEVKEAA